MERFIPKDGLKQHEWYEHWHRYHFATHLIKGLKVCDIACGAGYGSHLMAGSASHVTGVDIDSLTIEQAQHQFGDLNNLTFVQANALQTPFADDTFDCVVSFETLEHLTEHTDLLQEFKRILKPAGLLVISTPDKDIYSGDVAHNEFHEKELNKSEFIDLMHDTFKHGRLWGQKLQLFSVIDACSDHDGATVQLTANNDTVTEQQTTDHKYLIMVCSDSLATLDSLSLTNQYFFADQQDALLQHYEQQIKRLLQIDQQNHELIKKVDQQRYIIEHLMSRLGL